eukprot:420551-Amphidinium_carterae.1
MVLLQLLPLSAFLPIFGSLVVPGGPSKAECMAELVAARKRGQYLSHERHSRSEGLMRCSPL